MTPERERARRREFRWEVASLTLACTVPILGVLLLDWDMHAVMFLMSWEVITLSAVLAWLFNYPDRSTVAGIAFAVVLAPAGFLMWVVLEESYGGSTVSAMVATLFRQTWVPALLILWYASLTCRHAMADARERGARIETNNRILLRWIFSVFTPFAVFAWVMAGWKSIGVWSLATVLAAKTAVEVTFAWLEHRRELRRSG